MLRTRLIAGPELFQELKSPWQELAGGASSATPFQTWEWQSTWYAHYGGAKKPQAFLLYEGEDLVGVMPMIRRQGAWRTLRPMGLGPSDYLHPLARNGYEEAVAQHLHAFLSEANVDLVDMHQVRESRALARELKAEPIEQATCLVLDLPDSYEAYLATLSKSLRYDVRKLDKSLFKEGRATVDPVGPDEIGRGMDILFEQHKLRWRKRGLPGAFLGKGQNFHHEWASKAIKEGWLWLSVLNLDGRPIGAIYAMTLESTCYYYQAGFDPAQGSVSPGTLLVASTIRRAIEEGKQHFDFMRGDEGYKRRWKPQHVLRNLRFLMPSDSALGRLGSSWNAAGSRVESRVRARLEGRGLL